MPVDTFQHRLLYRIAHAYYIEGLTQQQIADRLSLSRPKVSRLLSQARDEGIVNFNLVPPSGGLADLERELEHKYQLTEAVVGPVSDPKDLSLVKRELAPFAAECLLRCIHGDAVIGIAWGLSIMAMLDVLSYERFPDVTIVQLLGGLGSMGEREHSAELARSLARRLDAKVRLMPAPGIVSTPEAAQILRADREIADTLALAAGADIALVGLGILDPDTVLLRDGTILTQRDIDLLKEAEAVGDIALRYIDAQGEPLDLEINERMIGLSLEQVKAIPRTIGVAGGEAKYKVIQAALLGDILDVLVTDQVTARGLIDD